MIKISKSAVILLLFSFTVSVWGYKIGNTWLSDKKSYEIFLSSDMADALDSLSSNSIMFDYQDCLDSFMVLKSTGKIDSLPVITCSGTENNSSMTKLHFGNSVYWEAKDSTVVLQNYEYGLTLCSPDTIRTISKFTTFKITFNDSPLFPWDINGGGYYEYVGSDSLQVGGVDINTVFRHELGHIFSLEHEPRTELITLLSKGSDQSEAHYPKMWVGDQEKYGMKAMYDPPSLKMIGNEEKAIAVGDSITFEIEGSIDQRINVLEDPVFQYYIKYPYDLYPDSLDILHISTVSGYERGAKFTDPSDPELFDWTNAEVFLAKARYTFKPDSVGTYKFKAYTAMDWNESGDLDYYEIYPNQVRPYSEVEFRVTPLVDLKKTDPDKSDYYAIDSLHVFEATCTDANWNDYPYMESMKFYYKKER